MSDPQNIFAAALRESLGLPEGQALPPAKPFDVAEYIKEQRMARWREVCPAEFQKKIDRTLIPNLAAWDEADKWDGSYPGIWLWSHESGKGKTRMLFKKLGQFHVRGGKTVLRITGMNLGEIYHDDYNKSRTHDFYRHMLSCEIVLIDDLDKLALPQTAQGFSQQDHAARNARMLRELFDKFYERHTAVLVTANESVEWFEERVGPSCARRMREVCRAIQF